MTFDMRRLMPGIPSCILLVFVLVLVDAVFRVHAESFDASSLRFELVREDHGIDDGVSELHHRRLMFHRDVGRYSMISRRHRGSMRRKALELENADWFNKNVSLQAPMIAGRDYKIGQYVVEVKVGTPPKKFRLIADLGSELTWVRCQYDRSRARRHIYRQGQGVFLPANSSTFSTIPCSSRVCKVDLANLFSINQCPAPSAPCAYDFRYADGSAAQGIFSKETITADLSNGREMKIDEMIVGCSESIQGKLLESVDGVLGLAYDERSFTAKAARRFGGTFSYCLMDHLSHKNVSSYLTFGKSHARSPLLGEMRHTKLVMGGAVSPFYGVDVLGISLGGKMLRIPNQVWAPNAGGGTIMDSGTSLTFLAKPAYDQVIKVLKQSLSRYRTVTEDQTSFEYCFYSTGFDESTVPRLTIHFKDGARFEPPVKSYVIDVDPGIKCIGLISATFPGFSVIGNILQQNHLWEFNLAESKVGFAPSSCT